MTKENKTERPMAKQGPVELILSLTPRNLNEMRVSEVQPNCHYCGESVKEAFYPLRRVGTSHLC